MIAEVTVVDVLQKADSDFNGFAGADIGQSGFKLVSSLLFNDGSCLPRITGFLIDPAGAFLFTDFALKQTFTHLDTQAIYGGTGGQWKTVHAFTPVTATVGELLCDLNPCNETGDIEFNSGVNRHFRILTAVIFQLQTPRLFSGNGGFQTYDQ